MPNRLVPLRLFTDQDLDSGASITSGAIDCRTSQLDHFMLKVTNAGGDADIKLEVATSIDGSSFSAYDAVAAVIASSASEFTGAQPEDWHSVLCTITAPFLKVKITDLATLNDNVVNLVGYYRE